MTTVFHKGELTIQTESGVKERVDKFGNKFIRDHIIDQHKAFFENLPYVFVALHDKHGQPWVSFMQGDPGFINSPDNKTLNITGCVVGADELGLQSKGGHSISVLGLDLSNRRRNRLNGSLNAASDTSKHDQILSIDVQHSFGNCPKYIQVRDYQASRVSDDTEANKKPLVNAFDVFSTSNKELLTQADTLFIASTESTAGNLDVNHRGGKPGFVRVVNDKQIWFNDYPGNNFFQTFGNIHNHPNVGLLFLDFTSGDLLLVCGQARLENLTVSKTTSSKKRPFLPRRFHFTLERGFRFKNAVTGSWSTAELSPFLDDDLD